MQQNYGWGNRRAVKKLEKIAKLVEKLAPVYEAMSDEELASQTALFKERIASGETLDKLLPEAFAVCREAATRVLGQRHYHVQILGGIALHQGRICQMATGEGKTLTETLPAYLNALTGNGVHIITVNEYLATRDMEWMGKVYRFLGLTVGVTLRAQTPAEKRAAYACDITYGTNSEFGFDYLRDNMCTRRADCVQRGLNFVIIDEVDSILIDEARTPLIISGPGKASSELYGKANKLVGALMKASTNVDEEGRLLDPDGNVIEDGSRLFGIYNATAEDDAEFDEEMAHADDDATYMRKGDDKNAADVTKKDIRTQKIIPNGDYIVNKKDRTVRLTERGIHRAEKYFGVNNLYSPENSDLNFYIDNALKAYGLFQRNVDYIVENREVILIDSNTGRKMEGRRLSDGLHQAVEVKERLSPKAEDQTFASITLQNYFRMYRKLSGMTGTAKSEEKEFNTIYNIDVVAIPTHLPMIRVDEDDRIFAHKQGKINAIVEEITLRHEKGQPLLVGTTTVESSEELSRILKQHGLKHNVLNAVNHAREAEIIAQAGKFGSITIATNMAGRGTDILLGGNPEYYARREMEQLHYTEEQIELSTSFNKGDEETEKLQQVFADLKAKYKKQTDEDKQKVIAVGGLCVIGTERHEARRIDDQLRGRAGRQGDPGYSVFFVSAEDDMIRIFAGDRMRNVMMLFPSLGDQPIQSRLLTKVIESAQKRVEGMHFSMRKTVLQYDDVNNMQRKQIFAERNRLLDGGDVHGEILAMAGEFARGALERACGGETDTDKWDLARVNYILNAYFKGADSTFYYVYYNGLYDDFDQPILTKEDVKSARQVCDMLTERAKKMLEWRYNAPKRPDDMPFADFERITLLQTIDTLWIDHTDALDNLRQGVGLQAIGQKDPLMEYKKQAYDMFEQLNDLIKLRTVGILLTWRRNERRGAKVSGQFDMSLNPALSLNGPCPCGSGKKYKNCCYKTDNDPALFVEGAANAEGNADNDQTATDEQQQENLPLTNKERYALIREERARNKKGTK